MVIPKLKSTLDDLLHDGLFTHVVRKLYVPVLVFSRHNVSAGEEEGERERVCVLLLHGGHLSIGHTQVRKLVEGRSVHGEVLVLDVLLIILTILMAQRRKEKVGEVSRGLPGVRQLPVHYHHLILSVLSFLEHEVVEVEVSVLDTEGGSRSRGLASVFTQLNQP